MRFNSTIQTSDFPLRRKLTKSEIILSEFYIFFEHWISSYELVLKVSTFPDFQIFQTADYNYWIKIDNIFSDDPLPWDVVGQGGGRGEDDESSQSPPVKLQRPADGEVPLHGDGHGQVGGPHSDGGRNSNLQELVRENRARMVYSCERS